MTAVATVAGEQLELHPERAVYWPRRRMLFVADPHFGKAASFRALGVVESPFALAHHPVSVANQYVLAGHIHPCAVLIGPARQRERLPCFWFGPDVGVLPAFGDFTDCAEVTTDDSDSLWVIADDHVIQVTKRHLAVE